MSNAPEEIARAMQVIRRVVNGELGNPREVAGSDELVLDLQLDSVGLLTLVVELENAFQVALHEDDAAQVRTVSELAALVVRRAAEAREGQAAAASHSAASHSESHSGEAGVAAGEPAATRGEP